MYLVRLTKGLQQMLFEFGCVSSMMDFVSYCVKNCKDDITIELVDTKKGSDKE